MSPFEAIVVLIIVGFLMLAAEVFVPGMVWDCSEDCASPAQWPWRSCIMTLSLPHWCSPGLCADHWGLHRLVGGVSAHRDRQENHAAKSHSSGVGERASPSELLGAQGTVTYSAAPSGLGIHRRKKGRRRG